MNQMYRPLLVRVFASAFLICASPSAFAETGVTKDKVLIGSSLSLTGQAAFGSQEVKKGIELYLKKINAAGGIHGRKIELVVKDDGYDPKRAVENVQALVEKDGVFAMVGNWGSALVKASLPSIEKYGIPLVSPTTSAEELRTPVNANIFNVRVSSKIEIKSVIEHAIQKLGAKTFALVYQSDPVGTSVRLAATSTLHPLGFKLAYEGQVARTGTDVQSVLEPLMKAKPDAVIIGTQVPQAVELIKALKAKSFEPKFIAFTTLMTNILVKNLDGYEPKIYFGTSIPLITKDSKLKVVKQFLEDAKAPPETLDPLELEGYLAGMVFCEALKKAGADPTRESLRKALETFDRFDLGGFEVTYSKDDHRGSHTAFLTTLKASRFIPIMD